MAFSMGMSWNEGEEKMHNLLRIPGQDNPTAAMLTPQASFMLQKGPLLALGTLDSQSRPWVTLWGGSQGFSEPLGGGLIGTRTFVDGAHDPVVQALVGSAVEGEMMQPADGGKMLAALAIDLMTRKRVKMAGKMIAGTLQGVDVELKGRQNDDEASIKQKQIQLVTKIDQSLGNCPKYLNQYLLQPALVESSVSSKGPVLTEDASMLIKSSDMFFIATSTEKDMDVNHRGGPPGFVRIMSPTEIVYPEYSGNRLYQSLGNLQLNPKVGITFPDYETGNVLYMTGTSEILVSADAAHLMPGSNLAVKITITEAHLVQRGLPFRGTRHNPSPYNPRLRPLAGEGNIKSTLSNQSIPTVARLVGKKLITPTIARFTFSVPSGIVYSAAQWVAMDFKSELDIGYEHMRDDDPTSLNDDFIRTFTISSTPKPDAEKQSEFEITIRRVGPVTKFLFQQNERAGFEVPILGVGGDFQIEQKEGSGLAPFIAGGVGITPIMGQLGTLDLSPTRFRLLWTLKVADVGLVVDTLERFPGLAQSTTVFLTGGSGIEGESQEVERIGSLGVEVRKGRVTKDDVDQIDAETWYICAGKMLRKEMLALLQHRKVVFEDFDY